MTDGIHEVWERGRAAWPEIALEEADYRAQLAERFEWARGEAPPDSIARLCAEDLFVACAALTGELGAVEVLRRYVDDAVRRLPALAGRTEAREEVAQALIFKLLAGDPPKLAEYSGRGPLGRWLHVVATRMAIDLHRQESRQVAYDDAIAERLVGESRDLELSYIRSRYLDDFQRAFESALAALGREDRLLLRLVYVEKMEISAIAKLNDCHQATAYRRVSTVKHALFEETCRLLRDKLKLRPEELQSLIVLIRSQLHLSIARELRATPREPTR